MTALARDQTVETSNQVINFNTNTAFKCLPHILGNLEFLQTVADLCADAHYYFAHSFNFPWGNQCPVRRALTPRATRIGKTVKLIQTISIFCCVSSSEEFLIISFRVKSVRNMGQKTSCLLIQILEEFRMILKLHRCTYQLRNVVHYI